MSRQRILGVLCVALLLSATADHTTAAETDDLVVRGRVVDDADRPVGGAKLILPFRLGGRPDDSDLQAESNENGQFEFQIPREWNEPAAFHRSQKVWCYAPGYTLATASAYKQIEEGAEEPIRVELQPATHMEFKVVDPAGEPLAGCRVEPHHWLSGSYDIPPQAIRELVAATTVGDGSAKLAGMQPALLRRVNVLTDLYGPQRFQLDQRNTSKSAVLRLRQAGTIEGRLVCDDPEAVANLRVALESISTPFAQGVSEGFGESESDADGRFRIESLAEAAYYVFVFEKQDLPYRPRIPKEVVVRANQTTELKIPFEPAIIVRGSVVARGSDQPVVGALVSVAYGGPLQSERVQTGANGTFEARVLPGPLRQQLISIPKPFRDWLRPSERVALIEATSEQSPFDLPPFTIVQAKIVRGTVVDKDGMPVAEFWVTAIKDNRRIGTAQTNERGEFELRIPEDAEKIDEYVVSRQVNSREPVKVVSQSPLQLQVVDPLEEAKVKITTAPTPEDKRQPSRQEQDADEKTLIVAKNILIFDGHSTDWNGFTEALERLAEQEGEDDPLTVYYSLTHGAYRDEIRSSEAKNWAELLSDTTPAQVQQRGIILNHAAERYDALELTDRWPPGAKKPVVGRAVSTTGEPISEAQVVLLPPPPPGRPSFPQTIHLQDGQVVRPINHITTTTDDDGQFQFDFPTQGSNVMIVAPEGFALEAASDELQDIPLAPWARITGTLKQDKKLGLQTVSLMITVRPEESGAYSRISMSAGSHDQPDSEFEFLAVPPGHDVSISRTLWNNDANGNTSGRSQPPRVPLELKPGMTTHVEFGPLEDGE